MGARQTSKFDTVLFDFGGVFTPSPFAAIEAASEDLGAQPGQLSEIIFGTYGQDSEHPWHRLERGQCTLVDARDEIIELGRAAGFEFDPVRLLISGMGDRTPRSDLIDLVRAVRSSGLTTAVVTNNVREFGDGWRSMVPVDELFDYVVDSCEEGCRKPDPTIFHLALERCGSAAPETAIFLDDFDGNLTAARALGIETILVEEDYRHAMRALADAVGVGVER